MAVTISPTGDLRLDQTALLQTGGTLDKDDISLGDPDNPDLGALPGAFASFLGGLTSLNLKNAATYGGAQESPTGSFITVETDGEPINDLFFSRDNGTLFTGQIATYTDANADTHPLAVAGSTDPIYLYSFAGGDILIGSTEAPADVDLTDAASLDGSQVVFAYYLEENGTHTAADVWGVVFQPLEHVVDGDTTADHDDTLDFGDFRPAKRKVQPLTELEDDLVLQREDVSDPSVHLDGLAARAGRHLDEMRGDPYQLADALKPTDDDPGRAEPTADVDGQRLVQTGVRADVAQGVEHAGASNDRQAGNILEIRAHGLSDARPNPVIGWLARDVRKGHDGHRALHRCHAPGRRR